MDFLTALDDPVGYRKALVSGGFDKVRLIDINSICFL